MLLHLFNLVVTDKFFSFNYHISVKMLYQIHVHGNTGRHVQVAIIVIIKFTKSVYSCIRVVQQIMMCSFMF